MKPPIQKYLNNIQHNLGDNCQMYWRFDGDGSGDFETCSTHATKEVILNYLKHLDEQKEFALKAIAEFYPEPKTCTKHDWRFHDADQTSNTYKCNECGKIKMTFDETFDD